jgi:hypothetical protein
MFDFLKKKPLHDKFIEAHMRIVEELPDLFSMADYILKNDPEYPDLVKKMKAYISEIKVYLDRNIEASKNKEYAKYRDSRKELKRVASEALYISHVLRAKIDRADSLKNI